MTAGAAVQKLMMKLGEEQEIVMNIADMIILTYGAESALLRVQKLIAQNGEAACEAQINAVRVYVNDVADKINVAGKSALNGFAEGDEARMMFMGLKRFTKVTPFNAKNARRAIAKVLIEENKYKL